MQAMTRQKPASYGQDIHWAVAQIKQLVNNFEGKQLPIYAVGAIEGYCEKIEQEARALKATIYDCEVAMGAREPR